MIKECYFCKSTQNLHRHHIFGGGNRKISERMGFVEYLCIDHHTGQSGVHLNRDLDLELKRKCQTEYEETHTREEFLKLIGKNYF